MLSGRAAIYRVKNLVSNRRTKGVTNAEVQG